jgi:hypothetical protein
MNFSIHPRKFAASNDCSNNYTHPTMKFSILALAAVLGQVALITAAPAEANAAEANANQANAVEANTAEANAPEANAAAVRLASYF